MKFFSGKRPGGFCYVGVGRRGAWRGSGSKGVSFFSIFLPLRVRVLREQSISVCVLLSFSSC